MRTPLIRKLQEKGELHLKVKVRPGAGKSATKGLLRDGTWKIDIAALAEHGKANAELIRFLSQEFGTPKSHVEITKGLHSPRKILRIKI